MDLKDTKYFVLSSLLFLSFLGSHSCQILNSSREKQDDSKISQSLVLMDSVAFFEKHHNVMDISGASYDKVLNFYVRENDRNEFKNIPDNILLCNNIEYVNLAFNKDIELESIIFKLSKLKKLERLNLALCNLDSLPSNIGLLKKLKRLDIQGNCFEEFPLTLAKSEQLEHLDISLNFNLDLSQAFMVLENCKSLKYLEIEGLNLTYLDENIGRLTQLELLNLDGNRLKELPCELMNLKNLNTFSVSYNDLDSLILPQCFKSQTKLGHQNISSYNIEGEEIIVREQVHGNYKPEYTYPRCYKNE